MKIGIDARLYSQTGVGRYIRNLVSALAKIDRKNSYVIFLTKQDFKEFVLPNSRWQKVAADFPWHSLVEQIKMPLLLYHHHLDLMHFPYFNVPIFYFRPFVVTLHDLTVWKHSTGKATTRAFWYFLIKKLGYKIELAVIAKRTKLVITISRFVKKDIQELLKLPAEKIKVIYEAVEPGLLSGQKQNSFSIAKPYLLTVGNFYPHKNLKRLIFAWTKITAEKQWSNYRLIMVGPKDYFYRRLKKELKPKKILGKVQFILHPSDQRLAVIYRNAAGLIFPSLAEGFGLPGLEAMALGCPVVCSDLPVFHEIYGDIPFYFKPTDVDDMAETIINSLEEPIGQKKERLVKGKLLAKTYSWEKCAKETLRTYENCLSL